MTPLNSPDSPMDETENTPSLDTVGLDILTSSNDTEADQPNTYKDERKSKIALIVAGLIVLLALGGLVISSIISSGQESSQRMDALEFGSSVVRDWMVGFEDIGDNTIILGAPNGEDDSSQSIALQELKSDLESTEGLEGIRVELEPGKKFEFVDNESGVVLMSDNMLEKQNPVVEVQK